MGVFGGHGYYENDGVTTKGLLMQGYGPSPTGSNVCALHGGGLFSSPLASASPSGPSTAPAPAI